MVTISRNELQGLLASCPNLKLVEVLPEIAYREFHLRGAINVPLGDRFEEQIQKEIPDKNQTIIVYSLNFECKISEQAVQWLLKLGYQSVYDYEPGKIDWNAARLPIAHGPSELNSPEK
ncbi:MAG: rhodanese-like domain-containing protein [Planctomycetes bacterium]|nr:rhodanese-like domain-containing protein [Planctomycetota bacterium]MCH9792254.1 rhodanese-like domain-containing protein [Planctomycetota bacterium]MDF1744484.1 rhodanese-like domain-containing protein [Gimesia sp.]